MRSATKRLAERLLVSATARIQRRRGQTIVLAFHNIVPTDHGARGDQSLHLSYDLFRRHLDAIQRSSHCVALSEAISDSGDPDRPCVAVTFDDAYRGAVELGIPELVSRSLSCTLFVAPGLLGARSFWWDDVAEQLGGMSDQVRTDLLHSHAGRDGLIRATMLRTGRPTSLPSSYSCAEESQLDRLSKEPTVWFGSHSWSHPNLARLEPPALRNELGAPLHWLRNKGWRTTPFIAYPYGLYSEAVEATARTAGYEGGFAVDGGWLSVSEHPWSMPRLNVPAGLSADGLILRLRGVLQHSGSR